VGSTAAATVIYLIMSVVAFALYAADKRRASRRQWRVGEATLHLVELLGGWPGALLAQRALRHKLQKGSYMFVFWAIVVIHAAGWAWWLGLFS
jgi:uncharacterized membrane protein YsdA (DUF1294 family)